MQGLSQLAEGTYGFILVGVLLWIVYNVLLHLPSLSEMMVFLFLTTIVVGPIVGLILFLRERERKNVESFASGRRGEHDVAVVLRRLPDDYHVFWDVGIIGLAGRIDFIVIGPTGVFVIEAKNDLGVVRFDGKDFTINRRRFRGSGPLMQTMNNAMAFYRWLGKISLPGLFVVPVLVFSRPGIKLDVPKSISNVHIRSYLDLRAFILNQNTSLSPLAIDALIKRLS